MFTVLQAAVEEEVDIRHQEVHMAFCSEEKWLYIPSWIGGEEFVILI